MYHAVKSDFERVYEIFKLHKQWFPHVRTDYIKRMIASENLILNNDVIITYNYYKRNYKLYKSSMGEINQKIIMQHNDCILHQIVAKSKGTASDVLQRFFKWTNRRVFLSVRSDNVVAKKFYEKNNMKLIAKTSWAKDGVKNALPGDIYLYDKVKEIM
jgi:hypothetical protein|tara:strand:+ start:17 stop:490 length:474 start_codon:yes stop_codon:yes gene_type:complete